MALFISQDCVNCRACGDVCPVDAISEGPETFMIDPAMCTECVGIYEDPPCIEICPVDCIFFDRVNSDLEFNIFTDSSDKEFSIKWAFTDHPSLKRIRRAVGSDSINS